MYNNTLMHYGVLGMKWGVRRTPAQLARARKQRAKTSGESKVSTKKASSSPKRKSISEMSDDELNRTIRRFQLEQQYRSLSPEKVSAGQKFMNKVVKDVVVPAATNAARNSVQSALQKAFDRALNTVSSNDDKKKDK